MMQKIFGSKDDHQSFRLIVHGSASDILGAKQQEEKWKTPKYYRKTPPLWSCSSARFAERLSLPAK